MSQGMNFAEKVLASMVRNRSIIDVLQLEGRFPLIEHYRNGILIAQYSLFNGITNVGKNYVLDAAFNGGSQVSATSWSILLISAASFTAVAATDTMAAHGGWLEFTSYSQTVRPAWGQSGASSQAVSNATPATFDITAGGTLKGIGITSSGTKGGTAGTLWSCALFTADVPVSSSDQIKSNYSLGC